MTDKLIFFVDATCDIPREFIEKNNIQVIGLKYTLTDKGGKVEDNISTAEDDRSLKTFYARVRNGATSKTSLVTYQDAELAFEPFFKDGYDIIHLGLSSGLAQTYQNALDAGTDLAHKYGLKFYAPDTKLVTCPHYLILQKMLEINNFDKIVKELPEYYGNFHEYFTVESLTYLHRGGRLSTTATVVGGMLNIKPIIRVTPEGKLENFAKVIGRNKSIQTLADYVVQIDPKSPEVVIVHADSPTDAKTLERKIKSVVPFAKIEIINLGVIIGTHTGPGTVGLCFRAI
ncbi:MAG: DegV family protein [Christensenellaceae bacterium]|jgi:DegV family protein with EDD domain|nr:DegV family protein [Christensenellaceae bacterium]